MYRPEIFITLEGLKKIGTILYSAKFSDDLSETDQIVRINWNRLIESKAKLIINSSFEDISTNSEHDFIRKLIKNSQTGGCEIIAEPELGNFNDIEYSDFCFSYFFLDKSYVDCKSMEDHYGLLFQYIELKTLLERGRFLFSKKSLNISPVNSDLSCWGDLKQFLLQCTCMLIADNYILSNNYEENLLNLLDCLLPVNLNKGFYLTIVTLDEDNSVRTKQVKVIDMLKKLRNYVIYFSIYVVKKRFQHQREIFTNYMYYHSGDSFAYFQRGIVVKDSCFVVSPKIAEILEISQPEDELPISHKRLNKLKDIISKHSEAYGECINPLLK